MHSTTLFSFFLGIKPISHRYEESHDPVAATKASIVGSLAIGTTFLLSPVSSVLSDRFGLRKTAFVGGCVAFAGMLLASFCVDNVSGRLGIAK